MKKIITLFFKYYGNIATGTIIAVATVHTYYGVQPQIKTIWEALFSAILTTIATMVAYHVNSDNFNLLKRMILHYISLCVIIGVIGYLFKWMSLSFQNILIVCLCVAGVYAFTYMTVFLTDVGNAKSINKALEEKYKNE